MRYMEQGHTLISDKCCLGCPVKLWMQGSTFFYTAWRLPNRNYLLLLFGFIPWQLQRNDLLFVMLPAGQKELQVPGWIRFVMAGAEIIRYWSAHIASGGITECIRHQINLLFVDVDNAHDSTMQEEQLVSDTYRYSAWDDRHKYRHSHLSRYPEPLQGHKISIRDDDRGQ